MNKIIIAFTLAAASFVGCKNTTEEKTHEHGLEPLAYTLYSVKSELFVEFKPLVVGIQSKFAAHLTVLGENFLPLAEGKVIVSLIMADKGIKHSADAPSVPGIYRLALTPAFAGTGKLIFDIQAKTFTDQIIIENVKVYSDEKSALADQKEEGKEGDITYLKEQAWKVEFANRVLKKQSFADIIKTNGQILSAPGDEMMVTAKASGIVLFSGNKAIVGSEISKGASLFSIAGGDLTEGNIDASYKDAKVDFEKAKADFDRASALVNDKIISERDYLETKAKFENAQTAFNTLAQNYTSGGQTVTAPMDGFVKNILVAEGQFVQAGSPLATVSKNKKLILQANVSQKYFRQLSSVTSANFRTNESDRFIGTEELNGSVISYGKSTDASSPFIPITFEVDNIGDLIPGSVAEVFLSSTPIPEALVVPVSSLIEEQGTFFVYIQTGGESFQKREVKLGAGDGKNVQVLSGVAEEERIVTKGAFQIKLSAASRTLPAHGHEH